MTRPCPECSHPIDPGEFDTGPCPSCGEPMKFNGDRIEYDMTIIEARFDPIARLRHATEYARYEAEVKAMFPRKAVIL